MNSSQTPPNDLSLIFPWDDPRRRKVAITGFLLASLLLHALCFYAFQIIYPPAVALLPPPARVTVISPNSPGERVLLRWLEAEDPALASITQPLDEKPLSVPTIQHAPSYLMHRPALKEVTWSTPKSSIPSAQPPGPVDSMRVLPPATITVTPTQLHFSAELGTTSAVQVPEMRFHASRHETPHVAQFRVALGEQGDIRYCLLENSSGDGALDEQARKYLTLSRFPAPRNPGMGIDTDLVWGIATIEWGNDIITPPSVATNGTAP